MQHSGPSPDVVSAILEDLPEWFGIPEANAAYVDAARSFDTYLALDDDGVPVGVLLLNQHFPATSEVHLIAVKRDHHRRGIGRALVAAAEADAQARGTRLLEAKTLAASHPDTGYAATRNFYEAMGFLQLEETDLWGEASPCLIMVKPLSAPMA